MVDGKAWGRSRILNPLATFFALVVAICPAQVLANVPAAFFACEGAEQGAACALPGPVHGACLLDTLCEDNADTEVNECLLCVDECWVLEPGTACTRRDGLPGTCIEQSPCTPDPEKSFHVCLRCSSAVVQPESPGCNGSGAMPFAPWALIGIWTLWVRLRRNEG